MNADDVVYPLSRHMGEDTKSIGKSQFDMVTSVKKVNEFEVGVIWKHQMQTWSTH